VLYSITKYFYFVTLLKKIIFLPTVNYSSRFFSDYFYFYLSSRLGYFLLFWKKQPCLSSLLFFVSYLSMSSVDYLLPPVDDLQLLHAYPTLKSMSIQLSTPLPASAGCKRGFS
jgi:hypothetical protein